VVAALVTGLLTRPDQNGGSKGENTSPTTQANKRGSVQAANPIARRLVLPQDYSVDLDTWDVRESELKDTDLNADAEVDGGDMSIDEYGTYGGGEVRLIVVDPKIPLDEKVSLAPTSPSSTNPNAHPAIIYATCAEATLFTSRYDGVATQDQFCVRTSENRVVFLRVIRVRHDAPRGITFETLTWSP
jgi:hypothetical protein